MRVRRSTLLQNYAYAQTMAQEKAQKPRWGVIEIDGQEAGLVQILEASILFKAVHAVILDRGPLWFEGFGEQAHIEAFFTEMNRQFPQRWGRKRRIIPESDIDLSALGYEKVGNPYETIWLDLTQSEQSLRDNLKKNWRGTLQKAETCAKEASKESGLIIEWDNKGRHLDWLLEAYTHDKDSKGYDGPSVTLLRTLAHYHLPRDEMLIGQARIGAKAVAGIMILLHGGSATYQIGTTSNEGRDYGAHHMLLWQALGVLKFRQIKDFDLGGINDETAKGVKAFKSGMGGQSVTIGALYS